MKKLLILGAFLLASVGAWAQSYSTGGICTSGGTNCTITVSVTAGSTSGVLFVWTTSGSAVTFTPSDTNSDTFTSCGARTYDSSIAATPTFQLYCVNFATTNASEGVKTTASSSNNAMGASLVVYSSVTGFDKTNITPNTGTSTTSLSTGASGTTSQANEMVVACFGNDSYTSWTAGTSYNLRSASERTVSSPYMVCEDRTVTSTGSYTGTATTGGNVNYIGYIVTLEGSASTATAPTCSTNCAGTYNNSLTATFANPNSGTTVMCYTSNGTTPVTNGSGTGCTTGTSLGTASTENLTVSPSTFSAATGTIKVVAGVSGYTDSSVLSEAYTFQVANPVPTFNPTPSTSFTDATSGATMYYYNNGSTPACPSTGTAYSSAISPSGTNSIQIIGCATNYNASSVVTVQPDISVASDNFQSYYNSNEGVYQSVAISSISGATINVSAAFPYYVSYYPYLIISGATGAASSDNGTWGISSISSTSYTLSASLPANCSSSCGTLYYGNPYAIYGTQYFGPPYQNEIDCWSSSCAWTMVSALTNGGIYPDYDPFQGGSSVVLRPYGFTGSSYSNIQVERTNEGYYQNQASIVYLHNQVGTSSLDLGSTVAGPAVRCSSSYCYTLEFNQNSGAASLNKWVSGSRTNLGNVSSGVTWTDGSFAELRAEASCVFRPLLNGSPIPGLSATYTDSGCTTTGQPGIAAAGTGDTVEAPVLFYNWSGYNIGGTNGSYTPPTVTYTTYTDALDTATMDFEPPQTSEWFHFTFNNTPWVGNGAGGPYWLQTFGATAYNSTYGAGPLGGGAGSVYQYHQAFKVNQWQAWTSSVNVFNPNLENYFAPLLDQPWIPGLTNGGCATAGTQGSCYDALAYYPGIEVINNTSRSSACSAKAEYCGTPFFHITKVTPQASPGNQVVTVAGSNYTIMQGDLVEVRYIAGYLEAWCKQGSSPASFANNNAYTVGQWVEDSNGNVQEVTTAGTSQTSGTPTWGNTWTSYAGATTTSGTAVFTYFGAVCPTTSKYTRMIHVYDSDLLNSSYVPGNGYSNALGVGFPTLWGQGGAAFPIFTLQSAGSIGFGTGEPCATAGQCVEAGGYIINSGPIN